MKEDTILKIPEPTGEERLIAEKLIRLGDRDIQKPLPVFAVAAKRLAEKIYQDRKNYHEWHHLIDPGENVRSCNAVFTSTLEVHAHLETFTHGWTKYATDTDASTPEDAGIGELVRNILDVEPFSKKEDAAQLHLRSLLAAGSEYLKDWSQTNAEKYFAMMKKAQMKKMNKFRWHQCCLEIYEYFCLKHNLVFYHFRNLYILPTDRDEPWEDRNNIYMVSPYFTAYAIRYPSPFTESFNKILEVVKNYSRSICDTQPFTPEDPWLEKRLHRCGLAALKIIRNGTLKDFHTQRDVFSLFDDDLVQDGEKLRDDAGDTIIQAICESFGVKAEPDVNPWKYSHLYAVWSMDDECNNSPIYQGQRMSRLVPFIDAIAPRKVADCRAELLEYYRNVYPSMGCREVGVELNVAADGIAAIAQKYLPPEDAVNFIRCVLDKIIRESTLSEDVLDAVMDRCRTYTNRINYLDADDERTATVCTRLTRYFPECRTEQELDSRIRAHIVRQSAICHYTRDMPVAYHILTEQNASDILAEVKIYAEPESERYVKIRIYDTLCALDGVTPYLMAEYVSKKDKILGLLKKEEGEDD